MGSETSKNKNLESDDLAERYTLEITGKKHDLIQFVNTFHVGMHTDELVPPDRRMLNQVLGELNELLEVEEVGEILQERFESGDMLVGEELEVELRPDTE